MLWSCYELTVISWGWHHAICSLTNHVNHDGKAILEKLDQHIVHIFLGSRLAQSIPCQANSGPICHLLPSLETDRNSDTPEFVYDHSCCTHSGSCLSFLHVYVWFFSNRGMLDLAEIWALPGSVAFFSHCLCDPVIVCSFHSKIYT